MSLSVLRHYSNKYGSNPAYVLAGGGNTSFKDANNLYIKGSGVSLAEIDETGFVCLDRKKLSAIYTKTYPADSDALEAAVLKDMLAARVEGETKRPSVETLLHDIIPTPYVLHLHPGKINGMTCSKNGEAIFNEHFGSEGIWVRPIMPGYTLAMAIQGQISAFEKAQGKLPSVILIENHGIFLGGASEEEIDRIFDGFLTKLSAMVTREPDLSDAPFDLEAAALTGAALRGMLGGNGFCVFRTNAEVMALTKSAASFARILPTFSPDHMVYCKDEAVFAAGSTSDEIAASLEAALLDYQTRKKSSPKIVGIQNLGFYAVGSTKKEADIAADVFMDAVKVLVFAESFGGPKPMPAALVDAINNWEVEAYRKSVAFAKTSAKRADNKIIIITGGAQGFGEGIARDLAAEGAAVVIADLNEQGAKAVADSIRADGGNAIALPVNVGNEDEIRDMVYRTVLAYGGLDTIISNAGIARAGGLEELSLESFELMTKINYSAYFLCAKYASRVMKITAKYAPAKFADIIQINSKSGLVGSNKNFGYAGSKFGGIGLTQSFALELAPFNIKVNSICPGNFLDGPLWCDPEKGLFVQYLKAGKVPGANTVEDVKRFYEAKVPLNRGCLVRDVVRAILYVMEQEYETGQAVPVTGGQTMIK